MARDDFTLKTISDLQKRVNRGCSNPACRVPTTAAKDKCEVAMTIGVAAHICAASVGGPRYNSSMSSASRKSNKKWNVVM
jgi:hypothetical protein